MTRTYSWFEKNVLRLRARDTIRNLAKIQLLTYAASAGIGLVVLIIARLTHNL